MEKEITTKIEIQTRFIYPFLYAGIAWSIVLVLYSFHWSTLLLPLSPELVIFLLGFIGILLLLHIYSGKITFSFDIDLKKEKKGIQLMAFFCTFFFLLEVCFSKGVPIFRVLGGNFNYSDKNFGLPFVHVALNMVSAMYIARTWFLYKASKKKLYKRWCCFFFLFGILTFSRAFILYGIIYCIIISFSLKKWSIKVFIKTLGVLFFGVLLVVFIFGFAGDMRSNADVGGNYIEVLAKPSDNFKQSKLPSVFLWAYCYITTPLANLQNTINMHPSLGGTEIDDVFELFTHFLPELITKRVPSSHKRASLIVSYFNVSSIFANSYARLGWLAMFYSALGSCLIVLFLQFIKNKKNINSYLAFVFLSVILFFNMFNNMFHFMGTAPQFILAVFMSFNWTLCFKPRKKNCHKGDACNVNNYDDNV